MISLKKTEPALWFLVSNLTNAAITFATLIFIARISSTEDYGVLALYMTFIAISTSLLGFSLDGSVSVSYFRKTKSELRTHVTSCIFIILIFLVLSLIIIAIVFLTNSNSFFSFFDQKWVFIGLITSASQAIINIKLALWMVKGSAKKYAFYQILQAIILSCITFSLLYYTKIGWEGRAWAQFITTCLFAIGGLFLLIMDDEAAKRISICEIRRAANFGVPLIPHICGAILFTSADRLLVSSMLGSEATGLYQLAAQIGLIVMMGTDAINKVFSPWLYRNLQYTNYEMRRKIVLITYLYFMLALVFAVTFFALPLNWALILGGPKYTDAGVLVPLFILGQCIGGMYFMVAGYIFFVGKTIYLSIATLISGAAGILVAYFLIEHYGLIGAAVSFPISRTIHFIATWIISMRIYPMPWILKNKTPKFGL